MSEGWETKKLGDVAVTFGRGKSRHRPRNDKSLYGGTYPFVQTGEIRNANHFITEYSQTYNEKGLAQSKLWPTGTLCITIAANIAETAILTFEACIPDSVIGLVCNPEKANVNFVEYLLQYSRSGLQEEGKGSAQDNINMGTFERMSFPFPSVLEQKRIVSILDEAFGAIERAKENAQKNLANARELFESYLNRVFTEKGEGWEESTLGKIANFKNGLNYDKNSNGQTLPVVGVGNFQKNFDVPIGSLETATIDGSLDDKFALKKDDILTVRSNGSKNLIGRCMLVPELRETTSYSGFVIRIRIEKTKLVPRFFLHFMKSRRTVDLLTRGGGGANINNINQGKLSALPVSFPANREEQGRLANLLDQASQEVDTLGKLYERKLTALDELKQSILQKAFTGQLTSKSTELELVG